MPPFAVSVVGVPEHTDDVDALTVIVGVGLTEIATLSLLLHPPELPITVYVMFAPPVFA